MGSAETATLAMVCAMTFTFPTMPKKTLQGPGRQASELIRREYGPEFQLMGKAFFLEIAFQFDDFTVGLLDVFVSGIRVPVAFVHLSVKGMYPVAQPLCVFL